MKHDLKLSSCLLTLPAITILGCCCLVTSGCKKSAVPIAQAAANNALKMEDPVTRELHLIGDRAVTALVGRDINTLLDLDHDPEDDASLKAQRGDLYCYLYDSSCISGAGANQRAVYDLFSNAPKLGIDASVARSGGRDYGLLVFYDKSQISDDELYSPGFLCTDKGRRGAATWRFIRSDGKWNTSTLFEYKTERNCKSSS